MAHRVSLQRWCSPPLVSAQNYNQSGCDPLASYLSKLAGGGGGGRWEGGGGGYCQLSRGEGLRATHYYHMHTSRVCVCLGPWGYRGMYALIAISRLCQEESIRGLKDQRHSTPFNQAWDKNLAPLAP